MNKLFVLFSLMALSATAFAGSPVTLINNNNAQLSVSVSFCNNSGLCSLNYHQQLSSRGSNNNDTRLVFPQGMNKVVISAAELYDANNNQIASLNEGCAATLGHHNVLVFDTYGTNKIYCSKH